MKNDLIELTAKYTFGIEKESEISAFKMGYLEAQQLIKRSRQIVAGKLIPLTLKYRFQLFLTAINPKYRGIMFRVDTDEVVFFK